MIKRISSYDDIERKAIIFLYEEVKDVPKDGKWRTFEGPFCLDNDSFILKVNFRFENEYLSIEDFKIYKDDITFVLQ